MIEAQGIRKRFGRVQALDGVTFSVARGEIVGFLGENGAGKTTTLRILGGFLAADAGTARIAGIDVAEDPVAAQSRLGYLPEEAPIYSDIRISEYLDLRARLKGVARSRLRGEVDAALERFGLGDVARRIVGELSKGYRQRVGLADALLGGPEVLILDEPTAGLDPKQLVEVREVIRDAARDRAVLISSHDLRQIEALATRILILRKGKIEADHPLERRAAAAVIVRVGPGDVARAIAALTAPAEGSDEPAPGGDPPAEILDEAAGRLRARLPAEEVARRLVAAGCAIRELAPEERALEELFHEATR